jgi:FkbM family methyltransferase
MVAIVRDLVRRVLAVAGLLVSRDWARRRRPGVVHTAALVLLDLRFRVFVRTFADVETDFGFRVSGTTADLIERRLYVFGFWERDLSEWLSSTLRPGDVFLDVGANVGYFSMLASRAVGPTGRVIAFEAVPSVAERLEANLRNNGIENVEVHRTVVSDVPGLVEVFRGPPENSGESATHAATGFTSEGRVDATRLDDVPIDPARVRAIKIDVEGDEDRVLRGGMRLLDELHPGASVVAEVSPERLRAHGSTATELLDSVVALGFRAFEMPNDYTTLGSARSREGTDPEPLASPPTAQTDVLFVKCPHRR